MNRERTEQLLAELGPRYRLQGLELLYRSGREAFRPSRVAFTGERGDHALLLSVDVRVPREAEQRDAERLVEALEGRSLSPRGFSRMSDEVASMRTHAGQESGSVWSLKYRAEASDAKESARGIRAIVESIDFPIVVGIHEMPDLLARDPRPEATRPQRAADAQMDVWKFRLDSSLRHAVTAIVDPNYRTLVVSERHWLATRAACGAVKLAHVARFEIRRKGRGAEFVAIKRDGVELALASGSGSDPFTQTVKRLAKKVLIPLVDL